MSFTDPYAKHLDDIGDWLASNAPATFQTLRNGLDREQLAELGRRYGFTLDADLIALLAWRDGCDRADEGLFLWPDFAFEPSTQMYAHSHSPNYHWHNPEWVPFATDLGLNSLVVDHGANSGAVGLFDGVDGTFTLITPSIRQLISQLATALTRSEPYGGHAAIIDNGRLDWIPEHEEI